MIRRITAGLSAFVVSGLVLVGCTQPAEPEPSHTPSVSAVPSPTPSPTPTMTEDERLLAMIPDAAKGDDLPAAVEMAKFFITLHPGLFMGEDPELFEYLSLPSCMFCSSSVRVAGEDIEQGNRQIGGEFTLRDVLPISVLDFDAEVPTALVQISLTEEAFEFVDRQGEVYWAENARELTAAFELRHVDGLWRVSGVNLAYD